MTCPTLGGKNFDIAFATSAMAGNGDVEAGNEGGGVFQYHVKEGTKGAPKREFAG